MAIAYIGIDNGHGKNTPGKRTPDDSMREWEFNYATAKYLEEELEFNDFKTLMVSDTSEDTPLRTRANKANQANVDIFVSIHANANTGSWGEANGVETFAFKAGTKGDKLAQFVQEELIKATGLRNRGVKYSNLFITRELKMPSILCECGFMDNKKEAALLKDDSFRQKCAKAICMGICKFFNVTYKSKETSKSEDILYKIVSEDFLDKNLVQKEMDKLKKDKIDAFISTTKKDSKTYYKLVVGSYKDKDNANKQLNLLKSKGYNSFVIISE